MNSEKLNEYRLSWYKKICRLLENKHKLNTSEIFWVEVCEQEMKDKNELSRKQSKTLNDIYERFINNNG